MYSGTDLIGPSRTEEAAMMDPLGLSKNAVHILWSYPHGVKMTLIRERNSTHRLRTGLTPFRVDYISFWSVGYHRNKQFPCFNVVFVLSFPLAT